MVDEMPYGVQFISWQACTDVLHFYFGRDKSFQICTGIRLVSVSPGCLEGDLLLNHPSCSFNKEV